MPYVIRYRYPGTVQGEPVGVVYAVKCSLGPGRMELRKASRGADLEDCYYSLGLPIPKRLALWARWYDAQ